MVSSNVKAHGLQSDSNKTKQKNTVFSPICANSWDKKENNNQNYRRQLVVGHAFVKDS